jgi:alpha-methylacyl-CoA racemase
MKEGRSSLPDVTGADDEVRAGPLEGVKVVEIASLAPGPFAACLLADMGADVVRIDRLGASPRFASDLLGRGRRSVAVDLKHPDATAVVMGLVDRADLLIEGFRPGVMERLGLGPDACLPRNPALVYGRMTGYGQDGPLAGAAGHDINYIALSGVLGMVGRAHQPPTPPLNLVGDFGGGAMFLAFGLVCALFEARRSGRGQVVDAAMVDGSSMLMLPFFGARPSGLTAWERGSNLLDSGAPFYDAYETSDGRWISVGAIEPQFYAELVSTMGLDAETLPAQMDVATWPDMKARFAEVFRTRTRDEWVEAFAGRDACFAPVLDLAEVDAHPHSSARQAYVEVGGVVQPAPAPRFSVTPGRVRLPPPRPGEHTDEVLSEWAGLTPSDIAGLRSSRAVG